MNIQQPSGFTGESKTTKHDKNRRTLIYILIVVIIFLFLCFFTVLLAFVGNVKYSNSQEGVHVFTPTEVIGTTIPPVDTSEQTIVSNEAEGLTSFFVQSLDNPESFYLNAQFPQGSMIEYISENGLNGKTLIKYQSREILSFSLPHIAISEQIESYNEITGSKQENLYRIVLQNGKEYYSDKVNLTEICTEPTTLNPPCALPTVYLESLNGFSHLEIEFTSDPEDREVADSIMKTLTPTITPIPVEGLTRFFVEPFYATLAERAYYQANFPNGATVEYSPGSALGIGTVRTIIKYKSKTLLTFSEHYELFPSPIDSYTRIENSKLDDLYRIVMYSGEYYSTHLQLEEPCVSFETLDPPCGMPLVGSIIQLSETVTPEEREIADSIMKTLFIERSIRN